VKYRVTVDLTRLYDLEALEYFSVLFSVEGYGNGTRVSLSAKASPPYAIWGNRYVLAQNTLLFRGELKTEK
jgi:hypothetical protein